MKGSRASAKGHWGIVLDISASRIFPVLYLYSMDNLSSVGGLLNACTCSFKPNKANLGSQSDIFFFPVLTPSSHPGLTEQWEIPFGEQHTSYPLITAGQGSQGKPDHGPPESFHSQKHKTQETHLEGSPKQGDIVFLTLNAMIVTIGLHEDRSEVLVCL